MGDNNKQITTAHGGETIDWTDIKAVAVVGLIYGLIKGLSLARPDFQLANLDSLIPFLVCVEYTIYRARKQPEKLDEWGLTTPVTPLAITVILALSAIGVATFAVLGLLLAGHLNWEYLYIPRMIEYLVAAFPQQFALCSVGIVSLSRLRVFRGYWRLPVFASLLFALAHFWTPYRIPGTPIPLQLIGTFPFAFLAVWYFLRFRTILPLIVAHAVLYVLLHNWVEVHL